MLTIGKAIQIRPNPHLSEWHIALIAFVEPFKGGYVQCHYYPYRGSELHHFKFNKEQCEYDNCVMIEGFSKWSRNDPPKDDYHAEYLCS